MEWKIKLRAGPINYKLTNERDEMEKMKIQDLQKRLKLHDTGKQQTFLCVSTWAFRNSLVHIWHCQTNNHNKKWKIEIRSGAAKYNTMFRMIAMRICVRWRVYLRLEFSYHLPESNVVSVTPSLYLCVHVYKNSVWLFASSFLKSRESNNNESKWIKCKTKGSSHYYVWVCDVCVCFGVSFHKDSTFRSNEMKWFYSLLHNVWSVSESMRSASTLTHTHVCLYHSLIRQILVPMNESLCWDRFFRCAFVYVCMCVFVWH